MIFVVSPTQAATHINQVFSSIYRTSSFQSSFIPQSTKVWSTLSLPIFPITYNLPVSKTTESYWNVPHPHRHHSLQSVYVMGLGPFNSRSLCVIKTIWIIPNINGSQNNDSVHEYPLPSFPNQTKNVRQKIRQEFSISEVSCFLFIYSRVFRWN